MRKNIPNGWREVRFGDIADPKERWSFTGGPFGSNLKQNSYTKIGVRIIQLQNIGDGQFLNNYKIFTSEEKADELLSCNIYPGEIILSKMGDPVARACLIPNENKRYLMASDGIRLAPDRNKFNTYFIFSAINSRYFRSQAENSSTGSTRKRIGLSVLRNIKLLAPSIREQERIVGVLEVWDWAIEKLARKIEVKKNIKKGLMQQLLTGKKRLSGFSDEWQNMRLGDLCEIKKGQGLSKEKISDDGKHKCILYGELYTTYSELIKDVVSKTNYEEGISSIDGDILIPSSTTTSALDLAIAACLSESGVLLGGDINILRAKKSYDSRFLSLYLTHAKKHNLARLAQGITIIHLYGRDFIKLNIEIPIKEEQNAIANILTSSDYEIYQLEKKLAIFKDQKKYLLNNLVTGAIRTPESLCIDPRVSPEDDRSGVMSVC